MGMDNPSQKYFIFGILWGIQMYIINTYNWLRRDFCAVLKCEDCEHEQAQHGCYDDDNYYNNVVPNIRCKVCGVTTRTKKSTAPEIKTQPRYDPNITM
jgi:hypothetical protein